ncbi:hypothetical protein VTJ04DRAFT_3277 [Mycothermus thermophilus]|uniref:uncharacterized protein n=1 Tax=Humicola insolens TaxID=85995 RepID=UPI0037440F3A
MRALDSDKIVERGKEDTAQLLRLIFFCASSLRFWRRSSRNERATLYLYIAVDIGGRSVHTTHSSPTQLSHCAARFGAGYGVLVTAPRSQRQDGPPAPWKSRQQQ